MHTFLYFYGIYKKVQISESVRNGVFGARVVS